MKKIILTILLCGFILVGITGCEDKNNDEYTFYGKVLETSSSNIIVEPSKDEEERKSYDKISINLKNNKTTYEVGTIVKITYSGLIYESEPAQIAPIKIEIVKDENLKKKYHKIIENVTLEMNIPNEWHYEELPLDENNDSYKYALKLYKKQENKNAILYFYYDKFSTCGTGRTTKKITLDNGKKAVVGYYENKEWSDISFYELNPNIAIINKGLENKEAKEVLAFVKTINIK